MILTLLEQTVNNALLSDPATLDRLTELEGRTIAFQILHLDRTLVLRPGPKGIRIEDGENRDTDVTLIAAPSVFARVATLGLDEATYSPGELEIQGDAILAQRFSAILSKLDIDWEELLAQRTGDIPARFFTRRFGQAASWSRETMQTIKLNISEYLVEEARIAAPRPEVEKFLGDVDDLRADADRLEHKFRRLQQKASVAIP
jgi:ubiquinone biosynthesis protein UbiJ